MSQGAEGPSTGAGQIYDLGYRSYDGERRGRLYAVRALTVQSIRIVFGLGRGARAKLAPFALLAVALLPAVIGVAAAAATGNVLQLVSYDRYFASSAMTIVLFCAGQAPELVGGDQQHKLLPLYFSRALRRSDYVLARLTGLILGILALSLGPLLIVFVGKAFVDASPWGAISRDAHLLLPILGSSLVISVLFGSLTLFVASLTPRRLVATGAIIALMMLTSATTATAVRSGQSHVRYAALLSPIFVGEGVGMFMFRSEPRPRSPLGRAQLPGHLYLVAALTLSAAAAGATLARYRRVTA